MTSKTLINRRPEKARFKELIKNREDGVFVLVKALSGNGKTIFTTKIQEELYPEYLPIRVELFSNNDEVKPPWFLTRQLASSLDEASEKTDYLLAHQEYVTSLSGEKTKKTHNKTLLASFKGVGEAVSKIYGRKTGTGEYDAEKMQDENLSDNIQGAKEYVSECFAILQNESCKIILTIENIQVCDEESLKYLSGLLLEFYSINAVFEYTVRKEGKTEGFYDLDIQKIFDPNSQRWSYLPLDYLPPNCIRNLLTQWKIPINFHEKLLSSYDFYDGNIKKLHDTAHIIAKRDTHDQISELDGNCEAIYSELYHSLENGAQFILALLTSSNVSLNTVILQDAFQLAEKYGLLLDYELSIQQLLSERDLIKKVNDTVLFDHDSLFQAFDHIAPFCQQKEVANKILTEMFEYLLFEKHFLFISKFDCLISLVNLYFQFSPSKLVTLLTDFSTEQMMDKAPNACKAFLFKLKRVIVQNVFDYSDKIFFTLLKVFYELDSFEEGLEVSSLYKGEKHVGVSLYRAAFLNRTSRYSECIELCNAEILFLSDQQLEERISLQTLIMTCLRSLNRMVECQEMSKKIEKLNINQKVRLDSYAIYLRNSQIAVSPQSSLSNLNKALTYYSQAENQVEHGKVCLTLSMQYGRIGELNLAKQFINKAYEGLSHRNIDQCMLLNNHAVINMLNDDLSGCKRLLINAKQLAMSRFNRIIISYNLLNLFASLKDTEALEIYIPFLLELLENQLNEKNLSLDRSVYYNLSVIYRRILNNPVLAAKYLKKAMSLSIEHTQYWQDRFTNNVGGDFMLSKPFHYGFLSHWSINFPEIN